MIVFDQNIDSIKLYYAIIVKHLLVIADNKLQY